VNAIEKLTDLSQPSCEDFKLWHVTKFSF
jgi:hypothetical protein